jgi:hypothetical protein
MFDLTAELPRLLPRAIAWAEAQAAEALSKGVPLTDCGMRLARAVGVQRPELVRAVEVPSLPLPPDPELRLAALEAGLLGPGMVGLTLGYAIYIVQGNASSRLIAHECRHVYQYETAGSIAAFLPIYLRQIVEYGYELAPLEVDARTHERDSPDASLFHG